MTLTPTESFTNFLTNGKQAQNKGHIFKRLGVFSSKNEPVAESAIDVEIFE